jgi:hypothetical protein
MLSRCSELSASLRSVDSRYDLGVVPTKNSIQQQLPLLYRRKIYPCTAADIFGDVSIIYSDVNPRKNCWRPCAERRMIRQKAPYYWTSSPAKRKIKLRVGTHDEDHRHEEWPRPFPVLEVRLNVVPDSAYRETSVFSPHDNRWHKISTAAADAVH